MLKSLLLTALFGAVNSTQGHRGLLSDDLPSELLYDLYLAHFESPKRALSIDGDIEFKMKFGLAPGVLHDPQFVRDFNKPGALRRRARRKVVNQDQAPEEKVTALGELLLKQVDNQDRPLKKDLREILENVEIKKSFADIFKPKTGIAQRGKHPVNDFMKKVIEFGLSSHSQIGLKNLKEIVVILANTLGLLMNP